MIEEKIKTRDSILNQIEFIIDISEYGQNQRYNQSSISQIIRINHHSFIPSS